MKECLFKQNYTDTNLDLIESEVKVTRIFESDPLNYQDTPPEELNENYINLTEYGLLNMAVTKIE